MTTLTTRSDAPSGKQAAVGCLFSIFSLPLVILLRGYVMSVIWSWFVARQFHTIDIGVTEALGLSTLVSVFTYTLAHEQSEKEAKNEQFNLGRFMNILLKSVWVLLALLLMSYVIHLFVR